MRPTFIQLEAFYWIARLGSVKEAARHLHIAPPTVSLRIDQLEAAVGSPLFERAGRGLSLTRKGEALVPRVGAVIEEYGRIREIVGGHRLSLGILRIGTTETFAQACLSVFMRENREPLSGTRTRICGAHQRRAGAGRFGATVGSGFRNQSDR